MCGGTGFYIHALVDGIVLPDVAPDRELRAQLERKSTKELIQMLVRLDRRRAKNIDTHNRRRLIRAIEIARALGKVPAVKTKPIYTPLFIGIDPKDLRKKINARLHSRIKKGMLREVKKLHNEGLSWKRMEELGLEYRYSASYLQNKITKEEFLRQLEIAIWHYAQRQRRWFKKNKRIQWFKNGNNKQVLKLVRNFLHVS